MFDTIDTTLWDIVRALFTHGRPAWLSDVAAFLSQVSLVISIVLVGVLVYVARQRRLLKLASQTTGGMEPAEPVATATAGAWRGRWDDIVRHLDSPRETDWKLAVMEADKLADAALKHAGFAGDTFGDRLTNINPGDLTSLDGLWWAHRVRNRIAHEMDYFLRYTEARQAVSYYESTLAELRLL